MLASARTDICTSAWVTVDPKQSTEQRTEPGHPSRKGPEDQYQSTTGSVRPYRRQITLSSVQIPGRDESCAFGIRNRCRFSFDRLTGQQWVGDVGPGSSRGSRHPDRQRRKLRVARRRRFAVHRQRSGALHPFKLQTSALRLLAQQRTLLPHGRLCLSRIAECAAGRDICLRRLLFGGVHAFDGNTRRFYWTPR